MAVRTIGVDAGGTLVKIAYETEDGEIQTLKMRSDRLDEAAQRLVRLSGNDSSLCRIALTGGKAEALRGKLRLAAIVLPEFEATSAGIRWLLRRRGEDRRKFLLTNVGTGTSIHAIDGLSHVRLGGTGIGGGTLVGLSAMLTGISDFDEIVRLASRGDRSRIDLSVSHIYEGAAPPIPGELTASNFGRWLATGGSDRKEDILASVVGMVGETVASVSVHAAAQCGASCVLYIGSSFVGNDPLRQVVAGYTELRGSRAVMVPDGEFSGAYGALLAAAGKMPDMF